MSEFRVNSITNQDGSTGPQICGVSTFSGKSGVQMPSGSSDFRGLDGGGRGRGIISGGRNHPVAYKSIDVIEISSAGNATDFGDLSDKNTGGSGGSSSTTRGFVIGGYNPDGTAHLSTMQYINFASQGGANLFGDLRSANTAIAEGSNNVRGLLYGGNDPNYIADIFQFNLQSLGTETDFGKVFEDVPIRNTVAVTSPTRAVFAGGQNDDGNSKIIAFREIASGGIVSKFGELTYAANGHGGTSSLTRAIFIGGAISPTTTNNMDFITIASEGDAQEFGDLTQKRRNITANSNSIRATFSGGTTASSGTGSNVNIIDFVTISTTGNAVDFGDLQHVKRLSNMGGSDSHGGLTQ